MEKFFLIGIGGFVGANLRYLTQRSAAALWGPDFPYGTLIANVAGSFIIGLFLALATESLDLSPNWRYFVATGILGGYTTFSSFAYETLALVESGRYGLAALNLFGNVLLGLAAALVGIALARLLMR